MQNQVWRAGYEQNGEWKTFVLAKPGAISVDSTCMKRAQNVKHCLFNFTTSCQRCKLHNAAWDEAERLWTAFWE
jgi:hypothetical protein